MTRVLRSAKRRERTLGFCLASLIGAVFALGVGVPARAAAVPSDPILSSAPIEGYGFDAQVTSGYARDVCFGSLREGTQAAWNYIDSVFAWATSGTLYSCREMWTGSCNGTSVNPNTNPYFYSNGCWSNHAQGRGIDVMVGGYAPATEPLARGNALVNWLLQADSGGNRHARARRLGVQQIIWNDRCWTSKPLDQNVMTASAMRLCYIENHRNHVHLDLTIQGANGLTSAYTGAAGPAERVVRTHLADLDGDRMAELIYVYNDGMVRAWKGTGAGAYDLVHPVVLSNQFSDGNRVQFADLTADGRAELIYVYPDGNVRGWLNTAGLADFRINQGAGSNPDVLLSNQFSDGTRVQFADLTADGRAELIYVYPDGNVRGWLNTAGLADFRINQGAGSNPDVLLSNQFSDGTRVQFADLTADGRAELIYVYPDGNVRGWLNTAGLADFRINQGAGSNPDVLLSNQFSDGTRVQFADLTADGRAELIYVYPDGNVRGWLNTAGLADFRINQSSVVLSNQLSHDTRLHFADLDGDRMAELIYVYNDGMVRAWKGTGAGAYDLVHPVVLSNQFSDGTRVQFADLTADGRAELIYVYPDGNVRGWLNTAGLADFRINQGAGSNPDVLLSNQFSDGTRVQFADLTADGRAELIYVYPDGNVRGWLNTAGLADFRINQGAGSNPDVLLSNQFSDGTRVQFADLTADGRAELIYVYPDGNVRGWLNTAGLADFRINQGAGSNPDVLLSNQFSDGTRVQFADLTADGKEELIYAYPDGDVRGWLNTGGLSPISNPDINLAYGLPE